MKQAGVFVHRLNQRVVPLGIFLDEEFQPGLAKPLRSSMTRSAVRITSRGCKANTGSSQGGWYGCQPRLVVESVPKELAVRGSGTCSGGIRNSGSRVADGDGFAEFSTVDGVADHRKGVKGARSSITD